MKVLAGIQNQNFPMPKAKETAVSSADADKSSNKFENKLNKNWDDKDTKKNIPVSKNNSVETKKNSSLENDEKPIEEKVTKKIITDDEIKNLTKQEAMWAFLGRMEGDLGIDPSEVVQAFAELNVDNLNAPPESSADEFIQNLNLDPGQEEHALKLYSELLTWTSAAALSVELQNQGQNAQMNVMSTEEYQSQQRMTGLNDLSDRFFMNGQHSRESMVQARETSQSLAQQNPMMAGAGESDLADKLIDQRMASQKNSQIVEANAQPKAGSTEELMRQMQNELKQAKMAQAEIPQAEMPEMSSELLQKKVSAIKAYGPNSLSMNSASEAQQSLSPKLAQLENANQFQPAADAGMVQSSTQPSMMNFSDSGSEAQPDMSNPEYSIQQVDNQKTDKVGSEFMVKAPQPTETEMSENIRDIINRAKIMVKDGGGEMKVSLRPEGMGNVNLKVNVVDGDVSVEMITQSDKTRKLLEKGLAELKDNLSLHKLNVDQIKVESTSETADKLMQQQQEQAERHFQERFLQDFRNQNGFKRSANLGIGPARPESQGLDEVSSSSKKKKTDRRLDLVA